VDSSNLEKREEVHAEEDVACGFCGLKWGQSSSSGGLSDRSVRLYATNCVFEHKQFMCGQCLSEIGIAPADRICPTFLL
jgi:hypothetical protein